MTTIGIGGLAKEVIYPYTTESLVELLAKKEHSYVLGNGSNVLPSDQGFHGTIFCTKELKGIYGEEMLCIDAGVTVAELHNYATKKHLSGWEFLVGIPATIGGLVTMNGGAHGRFISEIVRSVIVYDGTVRTYERESCAFGKKTSRFLKNKEVVLSVTLQLERAEDSVIEERKKTHLNARAFLPKGRSMGCVFQNPEGCSAGQLLSECRLGGRKEGGAMIAMEHANFILNVDHAREKDVRLLIEQMKAEVYKYKQIELKEEIQYLNDDQFYLRT